MLHHSRAVLVAALAVAGLRVAPVAGAQEPAHEKHSQQEHRSSIPIPESIRLEHQEIHEALGRATKAPGRTGEAARALAKVLHPHFVREEQIALPPLGLLAPLARGNATAAMRAVLPMTDSLRAELPRMLQEHVAIRAATMRMRDAARAERNVKVAELAEQLAMHARSEEDVLYPAAVLVGRLVRVESPTPR
jgi:hypothetical protein